MIAAVFWLAGCSFHEPDLPSPTPALGINSLIPEIQDTAVPTGTPIPEVTNFPAATETVFEVGQELTIDYLQGLEITGSEVTFQERLAQGYNYARHRVSYLSEGLNIYGLLTVPFGDPPEGGFKAVIFNHGYIPPAAYRTTERYEAYVDYLARSGFVVFKIDLRGHGDSEGEATGTYFSPAYTIDAISALKSLQTLEYIDPDGIGMWGHSMAGNLVLRAMLVEPEIQAGVIWAGAVYSYDDFFRYGIRDTSYRPPPTPEAPVETGAPNASDPRRETREILEEYSAPIGGESNLGKAYWNAVSLTANIEHLAAPIQLHHAENDPVVTVNYAYELAAALQENARKYELYTYQGGGHNLISPYFDQAMQRTAAFFEENL